MKSPGRVNAAAAEYRYWRLELNRIDRQAAKLEQEAQRQPKRGAPHHPE